jgi:uncharacterized membrane protein YfcA
MTAPEFLVPVLGIAFVAGLVQGLSGFGSALIAVPLLVLLLPVATVVPLMVLLGAAISFANWMHLRQHASLSLVVRLLVGYLLGTPLGLLFLTQAPQTLVLGLLGATISAYAIFSLLGHQPGGHWLRQRRIGIGILSGALGAAFSTNGPPVILHVAAHREWTADRQKATLVLFFLLSSLITIAAHGINGLLTQTVLTWLAWCMPALGIGTLTGIFLYRRLGEHNYKRLTFSMILLTGLLLVGRALYA